MPFFTVMKMNPGRRQGKGKPDRGDWGSGLQKQIIRAEEASILRLEVQTQARVGGWLQFLIANIRVILANRVLTLLVVSSPSGGPSGWQCGAFYPAPTPHNVTSFWRSLPPPPQPRERWQEGKLIGELFL